MIQIFYKLFGEDLKATGGNLEVNEKGFTAVAKLSSNKCRSVFFSLLFMPSTSKILPLDHSSIHWLPFSCEQDILITILARALKLGALTGAGE